MQNIWLFEKIAVSLQQISKQTEITPTNTHVIAKEKLPCNIGGWTFLRKHDAMEYDTACPNYYMLWVLK